MRGDDRLHLGKWIDFEVSSEDVLPSLTDEELRGECARRGIATSVPARLEAGQKPHASVAHVIEPEDLEEARSLIGRGQPGGALILLERVLPRDFRDVFTASVRGWR